MDDTYLEFFVKSFTYLNMWPEKNTFCTTFQQYYVSVIITITTFPILADLITQFREEYISFTSVNENFVALSALYAVTYVSVCFINRKHKIRALIADLALFEKFSSKSIIAETDKSVKFYTKLFIVYGIVGNLCYGLLPILGYKKCHETKSDHMIKYGIPCGLVVRFLFPFKFDYSPLAELVALYEIIICILGTSVVVIITTLICAILLHITVQLKCLKQIILDLSQVSDMEVLEKKMKFCVKYHTAILDYGIRTDLAFNEMMLLHITWTGFIISVLGFEITTTDDYVEAFRFFMHLLGWLGMLFLVCYYGQKILEESLAIADVTYSFLWYQKSVIVQKYVLLILLRSQKALTLRACGVKVMSLATFLGVLYSAYSYFTLLLKLKP
ncbi:odorant receptor 4-like [Tribolium madens]|uniref:odorant receptor 4-like n=1 Tax=Tribolium madens TaxID=41895 RepID=UPI001CF73E97|nr:odorant receptor 4-like [Tribolium madens]